MVRALLAAERDSTTRQLASLRAQIRTLADEQALTTHDDEHDPEGITIAVQRAQLQGLLAAAERDLAEVDRALLRVRDGSYGTCTRCGAEIGRARLRALPAAQICIDCARRPTRRG